MSRLGIDYAWHTGIDTAAMKHAGVTFVCRYLSHDRGKNLTHAEASKLSNAGIDIAVVWETTANRALAGRAAGQSDAREAVRQAAGCGMPAHRPIYFAVDFDATDHQKPIIREYFRGAADILGRDMVGCYAGFWVVKDLLDHNIIAYGWQTYAWSGGRRDPRAQLYQFHNGVHVAGIDSDWDRAYTEDFGQWRLGAPTPSGTLPASEVNQPGQHHNDIAVRPKHRATPLYYPNGEATGQDLDVATLTDGRIMLDYHELVHAGDRRYLFARGGKGVDDQLVPYGHVWIGDLADSPGKPVPAGDRRGEPARRERLVTLEVTAIPPELYYKPDSPGSKWATYGDAGAKFGKPDAYSYMLWSTPAVDHDTNPGGGMVRALVPNGGHLWLCDVERVHASTVSKDGHVNGEVVLAYCERSKLFGWVVVAHKLQGDEHWTHHIR